MTEIDLATWKRREHYQFFSRMDVPHFNLCFHVDITRFLKALKNQNLPFYYSLIYLATLSASRIDEFKYRNREDRVILHSSLKPAFTDLSPDSDLFKMVTLPLGSNLLEFTRAAKEKSLTQKEYFIASDFINQDDYLYITAIPWISFTHLSHTIKLGQSDSVPRISWGKYFQEGSKILLPFSVQVHHAFADGIHVAKYKEALEETLDAFCKEI